MKRSVLGVMAVVVLLGGCSTVGQSRLNPFNWFGGRQPQPQDAFSPAAVPADPRLPVLQVTQMRVDPMPGGVIVQAVGVTQTLGYWDTALLADNDGIPVNGVLTLRFVAAPPATPMPQGSPGARELTVARFISDQSLYGVRSIAVQGATNQIVSRR